MYFFPPLSASAVVFGGLQPAAPLSLPPACPPLPSPSRSFPLLPAPCPLLPLLCPLLLPLSASAVVFGGLNPPLPSLCLLLALLCPLLSRSLSLPSPSPCPPLPSPSPLSRLRCRVRRVTTRRPPLSASLCLSLPSTLLYFSLHFLPFLPPPLSFLPPFNDFLHFFVAVLPFSSAVCAFSATNVEFSHPPLRDKLVASPIPLHFPSLSPRSLHLPLSASLRPPPPLKLPPQKKISKKNPKKFAGTKKTSYLCTAFDENVWSGRPQGPKEGWVSG